MRFATDPAGEHIIRSCEPGAVRLRDTVIREHVIISVDRLITDWNPPPVERMSIDDFGPILELEPEVILFGSGQAQQFPGIELTTAILQRGIAFEVMTTHAACRTFNVLVGEQRQVVAALLVD